MAHNPAPTLALVGPGRAGLTLADALVGSGSRVLAVAGRGPDTPSVSAAARRYGAEAATVEEAGRGAAVVILAAPDGVLGPVASSVSGSLAPGALVLHLSGVLGLDVFEGLARARPDVEVGSLHPLQSLPSPEVGGARLAGSRAAVDGPPLVAAVARAAGLAPFRVDPGHRALYHAAACVASNHLVALLGQVERLAGAAGVPADAFWPLVAATLDNVRNLGPSGALTGPVSRGDHATVAAHLAALPDAERDAYRALAREALRMVDPGHPGRAEVATVLA